MTTATTPNTLIQRLARTVFVGACLVIGFGVAGTAVGEVAEHRGSFAGAREPGVRFVDDAPVSASLAAAGSVELLHDAATPAVGFATAHASSPAQPTAITISTLATSAGTSSDFATSAGTTSAVAPRINSASPAIPDVSTIARRARVISLEVTAYCSCPKCCGPAARGVTASGRDVTYNAGRFAAADTARLPFGTRLVIPGYADNQPVEVIDRGGAIRGNKLDVFFPTHTAALAWGRQTLAVTVVE